MGITTKSYILEHPTGVIFGAWDKCCIIRMNGWVNSTLTDCQWVLKKPENVSPNIGCKTLMYLFEPLTFY